jgi:intergrase/recombinase
MGTLVVMDFAVEDDKVSKLLCCDWRKSSNSSKSNSSKAFIGSLDLAISEHMVTWKEEKEFRKLCEFLLSKTLIQRTFNVSTKILNDL